jgi:hypothetical protein
VKVKEEGESPKELRWDEMGPEELSCVFEEVGIGGGAMVRLGEGGELGMRIAWWGGEGSRGEEEWRGLSERERAQEVAVGGGWGHAGRPDPLRIRGGGFGGPRWRLGSPACPP